MLALNDGGKSNIQTLAVAAAIGLFAIVGATYGLNLLSNVNEQETSTESDANTEAEELENRRQELMARASQLRNPDGSWKGSGDSAWNKAAEREEAQRRFVEDFQERNAEKVERENRRKYYDKYSQ
jgi:cell division protein FtsB